MTKSQREIRAQALINWLEERSGQSFNDDQKTEITDIANWSGLTPKQCYQWVGDTMRLAEALAEGNASRDVEGLFWIRIHVIVTEVHSYLKKFADFAPGADKGNFALVDSIKNLFNNDETAYIDYQRHCQCHMSPSLLRVKKDKHGKIQTLYKGRTIHDLEAMIETTMKTYAEKHRVSIPDADRNIARDFASRAAGPLRILFEAMYDWAL